MNLKETGCRLAGRLLSKKKSGKMRADIRNGYLCAKKLLKAGSPEESTLTIEYTEMKEKVERIYSSSCYPLESLAVDSGRRRVPSVETERRCAREQS